MRFLRNPAQIMLSLFGVETAGTIIESIQYQGDGWHSTDPCIKGRYRFVDQHGKLHTNAFARFCFDYNDYIPEADVAWARFQEMFGQGAVFRIRYVSWLPRLHNADFNLPPITKLEGRMVELVRDREAFFRALYKIKNQTSEPLATCLTALEEAGGVVERTIQQLTRD